MGCDIHFYVEKKIEGVWTLVWPAKLVEIREEMSDRLDASKYPGVIVNTYEEYEKARGSYDQLFKDPLYVGRNYNLFAMLANVRNGRGFAGVKTGEGFTPICRPKGVPKDASPGYAWEVNRYDVDGHSHSWLTVSELLAYDWDQKTALAGWVGPKEYRVYKEQGSPDSWSGGIGGAMVKHVSNEEMDDYLADRISLDGRTPYTQVSWGVSYRECAGRFLTETLPTLQKFGDPDDVRICFFFDN